MNASILTQSDRDVLHRLGGEDLQFDVPLRGKTTLRIGGPADAWFAPRSIEVLERVVAACAGRNIPMSPVGGGSNLLVRDGGIRGVVIATRKLRRLERAGACDVLVESGVATGKLLASATSWGLGGVEFLAGVPGSVGGGLMMNAGTYLGEFKDVTIWVASVRLADGSRVVRPAAACQFVYRGSALPDDEIVVRARLRLHPRIRSEIDADVRGLRQRRRDREPRGVGNAGSIFKNPPGDYAGRLIEAAGLKGARVGDALCSPVHANWLVNAGGATASDMLSLIELVRSRVYEAVGVNLELEVKIIGEGG